MADKVNLLLKRGLHENLPAQGEFVNGALYFTTDEGGLYLGKENGVGVRVQGSVLYFSTLQEFYDGVKPPYSTDVLYFIEKDKDGNVFNALMRWNGTSWVQINATAESFQAALNRIQGVEDRLDDAEEAIDVLEGYVGVPAADGVDATGLFADVAKNAADISDLSGKVDKNTGDISALTGRVDALDAEGGKIESIETAVDGLSDRLELLDKADTGKIAVIEKDIDALEEAVAKKAEASVVEGIDGRVSDLEEAVGTPKTDDADASGIFATLETLATKETVNGISDRVDVLEREMDAVEGRAKSLEDRMDAVEGDVSDNAGNIKNNTDRIASLEAALGIENPEGQDSIGKRVSALETAVDGHGDRLDSIEAAIANDLATKEELADAAEALEGKIDAHILAANAMRYMGIVDGVDNVLPTEEVMIGDTYIAAKAFKIGDNQVYAGDLIVAEGTENEVTGYISAIEWKIVNTGYVESHENSLEVDAEAGAINLMSHLDQPLSQVKINSTSANLDVQFDSVNNAITFGMVWDTF